MKVTSNRPQDLQQPKLSPPSPTQLKPATTSNQFGSQSTAAAQIVDSGAKAATPLTASIQRNISPNTGSTPTTGYAQTPRTGSSGFKAPNVVLRNGAKGAHVTTLQNRLKALGFNPGSTDGSFGPKTQAAVQAFQRAKGLQADGVVGPKTWAALEKGGAAAAPSRPAAPAPSSSWKAPNVTLRQGAKNAHVAKLQNRLKELGINPGSADGQFGPKTKAAVQAFQHAANLSTDGVVGPRTWAALEKGKAAMTRPPQAPPSSAPVNLPNGVTTTTGYVNGRARQIQVTRVDGKLVEADTARAYMRMKQDAAKAGVHLNIVSGFRTMAEQQRLYDGWVNRRPGFNPAARPGYSNHQSGVALDLNTQGINRSTGTGKVYNWLAQNAHKYGFKRIPIEHWHWEYQPGLQKYR